MAAPLSAQNAATMPAGVTARSVWLAPQRPDSSVRPLAWHMERGAAFGALGGLLLGGVAAVWASQTSQFVNVASGSGSQGGRGFSTGSTTAQTWAFLLGGTAAGALAGTFLGYMYHVNLVEQRDARCHRSPDVPCR